MGVASCITSLPGRSVPCTPCNPNVKNPLWFCSEPLGWAASHGQLHTVMALVANGANPYTINGAGFNAFSDAQREKHQHVVDWLRKWELVGKPIPGNQRMKRVHTETLPTAPFTSKRAQGCYIGACIIPILITTFWVQASGPDELYASGFTLCCPWGYKLRRSANAATPSKFELRAPDQQQDWDWHSSGCCFWGSPGWWALKVVPGSC